jgi:hypothetical protein
MIGFAVTSFFVSFAWLDPIYVMAAYLTGLHAATREYTSAPGLPDVRRIVPSSSAGIRTGWRVRQSAQALPTITPT